MKQRIRKEARGHIQRRVGIVDEQRERDRDYLQKATEFTRGPDLHPDGFLKLETAGDRKPRKPRKPISLAPNPMTKQGPK